LQPTLHSGILLAAREALERAPAPLSLPQLYRQLTGPFKVPPKKKPEFKSQLENDATIFAWPKSRFWLRDPRAVAADAAVEIASSAPLSEKDLLKALKPKSFGFSGPPAKALIRALILERQLFEDPPWGKNRKLTSTPPDPEPYRPALDAEIRPILEKYAALGITPQALVTELCNTQLASPVPLLAALERIEPRKGLVVAISKLRHDPELQNIPKADFDRAAMELFAQRHVYLHDHSAPHTLSAAERDELIDDGKGNYYVGIAWREPQHDAGLDS